MVNISLKGAFLGVVAACIGFATIGSAPANASVLSDGWYYSTDSFNDSMSGNHVGGTVYEIFGAAIKQTDTEIIFALNTNLPASGTASTYANDKYIAWGDLLFNFTGQSLDNASATSQLYGVRWANNESGVPELGVYRNVSAKTIARENGLLLIDASLRGYNNWVRSKGGNPSIGDLGASDPYFNQTHHIQNVIAAGTKIGNVNFLSDVSSLGLNFSQFGATGSHTFGFSFARNLLPDGAFIAHIAPECDNDVIALASVLNPISAVTPVPEPSAILPLGALGLLLGTAKMRRKFS